MAALTARSWGAWLFLSGGDDGTGAYLFDHGWGDRLLQLYALGDIDRSGDESWIRNIDATQMTVGLYSNWHTDRPVVLRGSQFGDTFYLNNDRPEGTGGAGAMLRGWGGDDDLSGAAGDDTILGDWGNDELWGAGGDDHLYGGGWRDTLNGGSGNDYLDGGNGRDRITGGDGDDTIIASAGNDSISGGAGTDVVRLTGNLADYDLVQVQPDTWIVTHRNGGADGIDTIIGAETLAFADGDHDLPPVPLLTARIENGDSLIVEGHVNLVSNGGMVITGNDSLGTLGVRDADDSEVPIAGALSGSLYLIDISGVTGGYRNDIVLTDTYWDKTIIGSSIADAITVSGHRETLSSVIIDSGAGNDEIHLFHNHNVSVSTGAGDDRVHLSASGADVDLGTGDDWVYTEVTTDESSYRSFEGGAGTDTLTLNVDRALVEVIDNGGRLQLNFPAVNTDTYMHLSGFEYVSFNGELVAVDDLLAIA